MKMYKIAVRAPGEKPAGLSPAACRYFNYTRRIAGLQALRRSLLILARRGIRGRGRRRQLSVCLQSGAERIEDIGLHALPADRSSAADTGANLFIWPDCNTIMAPVVLHVSSYLCFTCSHVDSPLSNTVYLIPNDTSTCVFCTKIQQNTRRRLLLFPVLHPGYTSTYNWGTTKDGPPRGGHTDRRPDRATDERRKHHDKR